MFASLGDNITPPQQAFNWVADVYSSTEEIKARGQVIVGLMQEEVGHLGIFVSGKVAQKEYTQIVSVMKIEMLRPGLYGMEIKERKADGKVAYEVEFHEFRLEEPPAEPPRAARREAFEAVAAVSEFNQRAYELSAFVQATSDEYIASMIRRFHPLRAALGVVRFQSVARVAAGRRASVKEPPGAAGGQPLRRAEASLWTSRAPRSSTTARWSTRSPRRCSSTSTATCFPSTSPTGSRRRRRS